MRRSIFALAALALLLVAGPARAEFPLKLTATTGAQVFTARAYDFVDESDHAPTLRIAAGYGFEMPLGAVELDLGYGSTTAGVQVHGTAASSDFWLRGLELAATYRFAMGRVFQPFARLGTSCDWATLTLDDPAVDQRVWHVGFSAMAGFTMPLIATRRGFEERWYPWLSLDFSLGYVWRPDYRFDRLEGDGANGIRTAPMNLGKLPLSGFDYRIALTTRF